MALLPSTSPADLAIWILAGGLLAITTIRMYGLLVKGELGREHYYYPLLFGFGVLILAYDVAEGHYGEALVSGAIVLVAYVLMRRFGGGGILDLPSIGVLRRLFG